MKTLFAVSCALLAALVLALSPAPASANGFRGQPAHGHHAFHHPGHVHGHFHRPVFTVPHFTVPQFTVPHFTVAAQVVVAPVFVAPRRVWVPGFWSWSGFYWVWVPGHFR